ncbi:hypothetical protein LJC56_09260 [Christensenellaceae bacterium OttesenSCG-928-K19]|nr:hypothetical protein [Christensenellaceae bacterium OttesenSCG-928-K19]
MSMQPLNFVEDDCPGTSKQIDLGKCLNCMFCADILYDEEEILCLFPSLDKLPFFDDHRLHPML